MNKALKNIIKVSAAGLLLFTGAGLLPVILGAWAAIKVVDIAGGIVEGLRIRRAAEGGVSSSTVRRNAAAHRANTRKHFFDRATGQWDVRSLPLDMQPTRRVEGQDNAFWFDCNGIRDVIVGRYEGTTLFGRQKVSFTMMLKDERHAATVSGWIRERAVPGVAVERTSDGRFCVRADNASDICDLVKEFYPPRTADVQREVSTVSQYVVTGCRSWEEALARFKENPQAYRPDNIYVTSRDTVDGVAGDLQGGQALDVSQLEVGSYVIDAVTTDVFSKKVTYNPGIDDADDAARSIALDEAARQGFSRERDLVEDRCVTSPAYSDPAKGQPVSRYVMMEDGRSVGLERKLPASANLVMRFSSLDELLAVASGDRPIKDRMVLLDTAVPEPRQGEFVLSLPVDEDLLSSMSMTGTVSEELSRRYSSLGLTGAEIDRALIVSALEREGYGTVRLGDNPDFSSALVNGVPLAQLQDRIGEGVEQGRMEQLSSAEQAQSWLRDAEKIKSVHIELDLKNEQMVIVSTVGTPERTDTVMDRRPLDEEQLAYLSSRGLATKAELKDLVMMTHPEFFETYRRPGTADKGIYGDPVDDFINGRRPVRAKDDAQRVREVKQKEQKVKTPSLKRM